MIQKLGKVTELAESNLLTDQLAVCPIEII
jgi:hypothetical protein